MFNRRPPFTEIVPQPTPAILIQAAIASVKPSSLTRKEAAVSEWRDHRSELAAEFNRHLDAARGPGDTLPSQPTPRMIEIQKKIDACDVELRKARAEMIQARQDFTPEFNRVADEFRSEAGDKLAQAAALIVDAHANIAAVEHSAQCSGIEINFRSHLLRNAAALIAGVSRKG